MIKKLILQTWSKIPRKFKEKHPNAQATLLEGLKSGEPFREIEFDLKESTFKIYEEAIQNSLQRKIDKLVVEELSKHFGFTEEEAYEILSKK